MAVDGNGSQVGEIQWESNEQWNEDVNTWFPMYKKSIPKAHVLQTDILPKPSEDPYWQWRCALNDDNQVEGRLLYNIGKLESEIASGQTQLPPLDLLFKC